MLVVFIDIFGHEHKFETWFENFLGIFFPKLILKSFYFKFYIRKLIK